MCDPTEDIGGRCSEAPEPLSREKREAVLAHGSVLLMFFLPLGNVAGPLLFFLTAGKRSSFVASHSLQAALFQALASLVAWTLFLFAALNGVGPDAHFVALLVSLAPHIPAALYAWRGKAFRFPIISGWVDGLLGPVKK